MKRKTFDAFFEETVKLIAEKIVAENREWHGLVFTGNPDGLYESYLLKKNILRSILKYPDDFVGEVGSATSDEDRLDRHKIAACMTIAVMEMRMFTDHSVDESKTKRYLLSKAQRLNEQFGLQCGLAILAMYMTDESDQNSHVIETIRKRLKEGFLFPPTTNSDSCFDSLTRGLFYSGLSYGQNPILLAYIFYMHEQYFYKSLGVTLKSEINTKKAS
ncbi:hypothetical protein AGMMS49587_12070 [Spirochaetia bacterium]|nr:hypothetical protein AGMMS49587_12070 [Spirochaetia bacterium]